MDLFLPKFFHGVSSAVWRTKKIFFEVSKAGWSSLVHSRAPVCTCFLVNICEILYVGNVKSKMIVQAINICTRLRFF